MATVIDLHKERQSLTVEELIERLTGFPSDTEVWVATGEGSQAIQSVSVEWDNLSRERYICLWVVE